MILSKTTSIMLNGIKKFNKEFNATTEAQAQIQVTMTPEGAIIYKKSFDWQPKEIIKFTDIMAVPFDILGYEGMAQPVMQQSITGFAGELKEPIENISVFIFEKNGIIGVAIFNQEQYIKAVSLKHHFINLGLTSED